MIRISHVRDEQCQRLYVELCEYAAKRTGYSYDRLTGRDRPAQICRVRSCIYFVLKEEGFNLRQIALSARRDHTTILYAMKVFHRNASEYTGMWTIVKELRDVAAEFEEKELRIQ